ncbi:MAG TPA: hypothetical protein VFN56_03425 [Candidatus Saccharimonadales bacterium]|nr:hypothetical protein [Candidatus Saccharimonadales bacterium]
MNLKTHRIELEPHSTVIATPSDPEGLFVFRDERYSICAVGQLVLNQFHGDVQRAVDDDDLSLMRKIVYADTVDTRVYRFSNVTVTALLAIPVGNFVSLHPQTVQEVVPVPAISPNLVQPETPADKRQNAIPGVNLCDPRAVLSPVELREQQADLRSLHNARMRGPTTHERIN